jgi:hypothetical protein
MAMKKSALILFALIAAAPVAAQTVEATSRTRWDGLPPVKIRNVELNVPLLSDWAEKILSSGECSVPGMRPDKFDIDQPYAVLVEPSGNVQRILVGDAGCPGLNSLLGSTVHTWAENGEFRPTGESEARWYRGRIAFARD